MQRNTLPWQHSDRFGVQGVVIAPEGEKWDDVLLVRYPSKQAFASMLADPEYREATQHRTAALQEARLVAMQEG